MRSHWLIGLIFAAGLNAPAAAAGLKLLQIPADAAGPAITVAAWYPSADAPSAVTFGPFTVSAAKDGAITGQGLPLVILSHGRGGSFVGHHDTAEHLADAGFVVAALNHPGDTTLDKSRIGDFSIYFQRPLDVKRVIDYMTGASPLAAAIDPNRIGLYGFSRGGYTGLVAIGANPDFAAAMPLCEGRTDKVCDRIRAREFPSQPLTHDRRIKAAAIADPLSVFFTADSFAGVTIPVQLWASETGGDGVEPATIEAVDGWLKTPHSFKKVAHAQHFSFFAVCPGTIADHEPTICKDAPGFDRAEFHHRLNDELTAFFRAHL
ncbi:MAG: prolyl oligopeptidase family serine peptidase [Rhodopseudomonas sp.]|uniref:alpha/beta hydrolase family protein n=1 Tax=Rhodopseudomonas sp. TaxID=1078 RepID=UPI0017CA88DD|nr:prolyl oligopeptidase family serine peptidase [Rhodopseudomonas sp.]NVN87971.1 prolyl oligopeptidase family serine peptidase [Rhodopseudomonas sp.]